MNSTKSCVNGVSLKNQQKTQHIFIILPYSPAKTILLKTYLGVDVCRAGRGGAGGAVKDF